MRGVKSLFALVAVAIALGVYVYKDSKHDPADEKKLEKIFAGLSADQIDQVTIKSEAGDRTTAQRQSGSWQLTQPVATKADEAELSGITTNLASLESQRVVDEQASNLPEYNLAPPRIDLTFRAGGQEHRLQIGRKTPTGTDLYAKLSDKPRVFLISSYLDTTFNRSSFDLRDKTVLKVDRDRADSVQVTTGDRTIKFSKTGTEWRMTAPVQARADFGTVEGIIGRVSGAQMKALTAQNPTDLKEYGLDKPDVLVQIGSGSSQAGLALGKNAGTGVMYARDLSRPLIFTVESALADELKKSPDDFRLKDLFEARAFNTARIEIARNGQTIAFEKLKTDGRGTPPPQETWKQVSPAVKNADASKVDALLTALTGARVNAFVETIKDTGLDAPELTVALKTDDQKQEKVAFGRHGEEAYARREGDPGAAKIDPSALDGILKALEALK